MMKKVKNLSLQACFISYRLREVVFCESPGLISLVAFDLALRAQSEADPTNCKYASVIQFILETQQANGTILFAPESQEAENMR